MTLITPHAPRLIAVTLLAASLAWLNPACKAASTKAASRSKSLATQRRLRSNKALVRSFYEQVFNKGNLSAIDQLTAPNLVDHTLMPGQKPGRDAFKAGIKQFRAAFPDMHFTVDDQIASGDKVVARYTMRGTHLGRFAGMAPTGRKVTVGGVDIVRIVNRKAVEHWGYGDDLGLMQQLQGRPTPHP